jgi:hypothetical protein
VTGFTALFVRGTIGMASGVVAAACYIAVTLLFYYIFKPVNPILSLLAAFISLVGCAIGPLGLFVPAASSINPLVFFGFYCLLVGYLIYRSTFLPRTLGVLMAFGGLGWLTFLSASLANYLSPYNFVPGILGEGALTVWLLVMGVDSLRGRSEHDGSWYSNSVPRPGGFFQTARPSFEVASIRPSTGAQQVVAAAGRVDGAQFRIAGLTIKDYISLAYAVKLNQISGPDWSPPTDSTFPRRSRKAVSRLKCRA